MNVKDLLNPAPKEEPKADSTPLSRPERPTLPPLQTQLSPMQKPSKPKLAKDAPIFRKGPTKGEVLFPPIEAGDDKELAAQYEQFQIFPRGEIAEYCHHIPYSSDKKTFLTKTGRDAFEVYQYTFKLPGEDREYTVMWDYNIGLVRVTPFFKCCKYSKTTPAKVLNVNPGLRDITHSITGGALTAQGYWMPFECAKAVAATFCYDLRHALVPVFGKDFPNTCVHSTDAAHGNFRIDPDIIMSCTAETRKWLQRPDARFTPSSSREPSEMPGTPRSGTVLPAWKKIRPRAIGSAASPESGYETGTSVSAVATPNLSPSTAWASINKPRAGTPADSNPDFTAATSLLMLSSPKGRELPSPKEIPRSVATMTTPEKRRHEELEKANGSSGPSSPDSEMSSPKLGRKVSEQTGFKDAALMLLELHSRGKGPEASCVDEHRDKRMRHGSVPPQLP